MEVLGEGVVVGMIQNAISVSDDVPKFIRSCLIIFRSQDKESWAAEAENYLSDGDFMRKVGFLSSVKEDVGLRADYFGDDKGDFDPLFYREDDERLVSDVQVRFLGYLGKIMSELTGEVSL